MPEELPDLTDEMKAAIGTSGPPVTYEVTSQGIRTFARSLGYTNPIYYDEAAAKQKGYDGLVAPPGFLGMPIFNPNEGGERRWPNFETPFTRNLNGGNAVEPIETVYAGDVLTAVTTLTSMNLRSSRMGQMLIRETETVYTRESDGKVVAKTRGTGLSY